jgi:nucleoid DNA-binding protein
MNKKETTEAIKNFVEFNSIDISYLMNTQPEVGKVFNLVLNELSKEYGSGEPIEIKEEFDYTKLFEIQERPAQEVSELKVGDKVYIPTAKRASSDAISSSNVIKNNRNPFLWVTEIDFDDNSIVLNDDTTDTGDFFYIDDVVPYPGNPMIGDTVIVKGNYPLELTITDYDNRYKRYTVVKTEAQVQETSPIGALWLASNLYSGAITIKGVEESLTKEQEPEAMIDPDAPLLYSANSLVGLTIEQVTSRKYEEYKVLELKKIKKVNVEYRVSGVESGNTINLSIPKTMIPELLRGKTRNGVRIKEIADLTENERRKRIKNYDKPTSSTPAISQPTSQVAQGQYSLNISTLPEKVNYYAIIDVNTGDRPSPSQSAGELKSKYGLDSKVATGLLNTLFAGNDGKWYKLSERGNKWVWAAAKQDEIDKYMSTVKDYSKMSKPELNDLKNEITEALSVLEPSDEEYKELTQELSKINKYI